MTTPTFVRAYPTSGTLGGSIISGGAASFSVNIDTTGLGASGAVVVFVLGGKVGGNMTGASFSTPTLGGSSTGWTENIAETICAPGTTGMMGAWVCLNPTSSASIALALAFTGGSGGSSDRIAAVVGLYSDVASVNAFTADNDGGSSTSDTMTNAAGAGNLTAGAWSHGSNISSVDTGTLRGAINNHATDYANGCIVFIEGNTEAFSSGSSDTNLGMQVELVATGGAAIGEATPVPVRPGGPGGLFGPMAFQWVQQLGADEVITGSPQTVTAQVADLVLTAIPGTVTAGNATVTAQVATLTLTAIPGTTTGGPTTVTAQVASLTLTAIPGTVVAGGITGTAQVATLTLTAIPGTTTPGNATIPAQVATVTLTAIAGTVTGGATTLTAQVGQLTLTAIPGTPSTVGGGQSVTAQVATLTLTAKAGTVTGGATSLTAQVAQLTLTAVPGTPTPGGITRTAQIATLALTAVPGTISATVTITAQVATLTLLGRAGALTPGPATQQAQVALLTLAGVAGTPFVGTIQPLIPPFASVINGYTSFTADGVKSVTRSTITTTSTVGTTPRTSTRNTTPEGVT